MLRNHSPIIVEEFNGLWDRGDDDSCPQDHFTNCNNIEFSQSSVLTRQRFAKYATTAAAIVRTRVFTTAISGVSTTFLLSLDASGNFLSQQIAPTIAAVTTLPAVAGMDDFDLVNINGRAYITFSNLLVGGFSITNSVGVYVYDGVTFRITGSPTLPFPTMTSVNSATAGSVTAGVHAFLVVYETDSGFIGPPSTQQVEAAPTVTAPGNKKVTIANIPVAGAGRGVIARRLIATRAQDAGLITGGNVITNVPFFFIPGGRIPDNTTTSIDVDFVDSQLLEDATYLLDIFQTLPLGVGIDKYHNRMIIWGTPFQTAGILFDTDTDPSTIYVSNINSPETISKFDGIVIVDPASSTAVNLYNGGTTPVGLTEAQEYRDLLYSFKLDKTYAITDNGSFPSSWPITIVDEGTGAFVKGVATVLDGGGVNVDYLIVCDKSGAYVFNGYFRRPEISWKIADLWKTINTIPASSGTNFKYASKFNISLDTKNKKIFINCGFAPGITPDVILLCDYNNATSIIDPNFAKQVRWGRWNFGSTPNLVVPGSMTLYDDNSSVNLIINNRADGDMYLYNGSGALKETLSSPFIQSYLISGDEGGITHLGAIRFRINGPVIPINLSNTVYNEDASFSKVLANISISASPGKEPTILANFISQKFYIKTFIPDNGYFNINKIIYFVKPMYSGLPG